MSALGSLPSTALLSAGSRDGLLHFSSHSAQCWCWEPRDSGGSWQDIHVCHIFLFRPFGPGFLYRNPWGLQSGIICQPGPALAWFVEGAATSWFSILLPPPNHSASPPNHLPFPLLTALCSSTSGFIWEEEGEQYWGIWGSKAELWLQLSCRQLWGEAGISLIPRGFRNKIH